MCMECMIIWQKIKRAIYLNIFFLKLEPLFKDVPNKSGFTVSISVSETVQSKSLRSVTIHSLSLVVPYQMTRARKIKSTPEWIISNSNENIMCS